MKLCILCGKHLKSFKSTNVDWKLRETHKKCFKNDVYSTPEFKQQIRDENIKLIKVENMERGEKNEKKLLKVFHKMKHFKDVFMTKPRYPYDFQDDNNKYMVELKSRNCNKDTYNYVKISLSKYIFMVNKINGKEMIQKRGNNWVNKLKNKPKQFKLYKGIFVYTFNDGDYFCYIDELEKKGKNKNCYILRGFKGRSDRDTSTRIEDKPKDILFISKSILKPIADLRRRKFQKNKK